MGQKAAAREKTDRYGPTVSVVNFGVFGRLGAEGMEALTALAHAGAMARGDDEPPPRAAERWRAALERSMLWAQADVALLAMGATGRHSLERRSLVGA